MMDRIETADLLPEILEALLQLLDALGPEEWTALTICPGWTVHDVAAHLLGVEIGNVSRRRDGQGDPWWESATGPLAPNLNAWNEAWVVTARRISPRLLHDLLGVAGREMNAYVASLDLDVLGGPVTWAGPRPAPVWLDVAREYMERWVHQQQIRDAVDRPGLTEPGFLAPVVATAVHALPEALREVTAPRDTAVRLIVTGDAGGRWLAVHDGTRWTLHEDDGREAAATVTLDADLAWRLWTGGVPIERARRLVRIQGDQALGERVLHMVSIIA